MKLTRLLLVELIAALALLPACGSNEASAAKEPAADAAAPQSRSARLEPCKLISDAQVKSVVPDLAGSMVMSSGESLMKTVESYQCSHVNTAAEGLIVIVHIAADDASFSLIKGGSSRFDEAKKLDIGDAAWLYPKDGGIHVTVHKGRTIIDLLLNTKDAAQKTSVLTELARTVTAKVG